MVSYDLGDYFKPRSEVGQKFHQEEGVGEHEGVQEVGGGLSEVYKMEYPLDMNII